MLSQCALLCRNESTTTYERQLKFLVYHLEAASHLADEAGGCPHSVTPLHPHTHPRPGGKWLPQYLLIRSGGMWGLTPPP